MGFEIELIGEAELARGLDAKGAAVDTKTLIHTVASVKAVGQSAFKRLYMPKRVNVQDYAKGGRSRSRPIRERVDRARGTGLIELRTFRTSARSPAIAKFVPEKKLIRRNLWIKAGPAARGAGGRFAGMKRIRHDSTSRAGLRKVFFRKAPRLAEWARTADQYRRHVITLSDAKARLVLVLGPALEEHRPAIIEGYRRALGEGLK